MGKSEKAIELENGIEKCIATVKQCKEELTKHQKGIGILLEKLSTSRAVLSERIKMNNMVIYKGVDPQGYNADGTGKEMKVMRKNLNGSIGLCDKDYIGYLAMPEEVELIDVSN